MALNTVEEGNLGPELRYKLNKAISNQVYASQFGVTADGVTDDTNALRAAITAANAFYADLVGYYKEVILPAGIIRITGPIVVQSNIDALKFRLRGAGRESTTILADFSSANAAPQFTVSGGGGSGAVLYPMIEFGFLKAVMVISGGTGYSTAPTATLVAPSGSGATVTCTVSGGAVTSVTVTNKGSGYTENYAGDAIVVRGRCSEVSDLTVLASASRQAASNGGTSAYPYFTTNNGIRIEPFTGTSPNTLNTFATAIELGVLKNVSVSDQPGHGVNAGRVEQHLFDQVFASSNGADGIFLHIQGGDTGAFGIANRLSQCRASYNAYRGLNIIGMVQMTVDDAAIFQNLAAGTLPAGVNEEIYLEECYVPRLRSDVERDGGDVAGKDLIKLAGCFSPKVEGYFRGGRYGVYCAATRMPSFDNIIHYGNPGAASNSILFFDSATGNIGAYAPLIGGVYNLGNVNLTVNRDAASLFISGIERGVTFFNGLRGSQYRTTQSTTYNLNYFSGCDHIVTLTGNVNFTDPTEVRSGVRLVLVLVQDATGGRTPTFGSAFVGVGSLGSGTANQMGVLELQCVTSGARSVWFKTSWSGWL